MRTIRLPAVEEALKYGYAQLADPDDLYLSPQWIKMEEEVGIARPFHLLCLPDQDDTPAVAAAWGLVVEATAFWPYMRVDLVLKMLLEKHNVLVNAEMEENLRALMPSAYVGALRGGTTRLQVSPALGEAAARRAVSELLDEAEAMARADRIRSIAFLYIPPEDAVLRQVLEERGYTAFGSAHNVSVLRLPGQTFQDYLGGFGKRRRDSIRWERRKIAAAGVQIGVETLNRGLSEEMMPLEAQLYLKYGHQAHPTEMARRLHDSVIAEYGAAAQVITARADGALRGYAAFIQVGQALYSRDTGYDYAWQQGLPLYFEVLFYSAIELALQSGAREINYSYGSDETKASRGCDLLPRVTYVKALDEQASAGLSLLRAALASPLAGTAPACSALAGTTLAGTALTDTARPDA